MWSYVLCGENFTFDIATNVMIVMKTRRCLGQQTNCAGTHTMLRRVTRIVLSPLPSLPPQPLCVGLNNSSGDDELFENHA